MPVAIGSGRHNSKGGIISDSGSMRPQLDWLAFTPTAPASTVLRDFERLGSSRRGRRRIARNGRAVSPYRAALEPEVLELRPGLSRVGINASRALRSSDGLIDGAAVAALCQLAAELVLDAGMPEGVRACLHGLSLACLHETRLDLSALARLDKKEWLRSELVSVPVTVSDSAQVEVARAVISFRVTPEAQRRAS
jgi:acyl-coenzyme A thioesterase PaaI-like protein